MFPFGVDLTAETALGERDRVVRHLQAAVHTTAGLSSLLPPTKRKFATAKDFCIHADH